MTAKQSRQRLPLPLFLIVTAVLVAAVSVGIYASHTTEMGRNSQQQGLQRGLGNRISAIPAAKVAANQERALKAYGRLPMAFEPNEGQTDPRVKYMARMPGYTLFLTSEEAIFATPLSSDFSRLSDVARLKRFGFTSTNPKPRATDPHDDSRALLRIRIAGGYAHPEVRGDEQQPAKTNYILGRDPKNWHLGVPQYSRVRYRGVYPGVDMAFHGTRQLEFDYVVNPGADPQQITIGFQGAKQMRIEKSGDLVLVLPTGELRFLKPVAYQENNGVREAVDARFVARSTSQIGFALGSYNRTRQLVVDPLVAYSTYLGGGLEDQGYGIAVDSSNNAYVVGATSSTSFPGHSGSPIGPGGGSFDCFLTQLTFSGSLGFTTIFGGSAIDIAEAVGVDPTGIYVTGSTTSTDFPVTSKAVQAKAPGGSGDGFLAKFAPNGASVTWATYIGGSGNDIGYSVAADQNQNVYVAGMTTSGDLPVTNSLPFGNALNLNLGTGLSDGFLAEVRSDGGAYLSLSYIGGSGLDIATGVAVVNGNVYVSGLTQSTNLPFTPANVFQSSCAPDGSCNLGHDYSDAFVAKVDPATTPPSYVYLTYLGGNNADVAEDITADAAGNAYVTGRTASSDFPVTANARQSTLSSNATANAFVTVLNPTATPAGTAALVYSTYLGGGGTDTGLAIALDSSNNIYVTGETTSKNFPVTASAPQGTFGGGGVFGSDAFVSEFTTPIAPKPSLAFSTYLGGSGDEDVNGGFMAADAAGDIYVTGDTNSTNFPTQAAIDGSLNGGASPQPTCSDITLGGKSTTCFDAFVTRYSAASNQLSVTLAGTTKGTVTSNPAGIKCSSGTCSAGFAHGAKVALTAAGASGSGLSNWSGACSGMGTCNVVLNSNQAVTATFDAPAFTMNATALSPGTVSAGGSSSSTITVTSTKGGFNSSVSFSCSISPATSLPPTCSADAVTPPAGGSAQAKLTVSTTGTSALMKHPLLRRAAPFYAMLLPVGGMALLGAGFSSRRKKLLGLLIVCSVLSGLIFLVGCGGSSSSSNSNNSGGGGGTAAGTYTITVTGSASGVTAQTASLTLTVQ